LICKTKDEKKREHTTLVATFLLAKIFAVKNQVALKGKLTDVGKSLLINPGKKCICVIHLSK
jgi:hypothetical protein